MFKLIAPFLLLIALVFIVFGQTVFFQFVNYDDPLYVGVLDRTHFESPLEALKWSFTYMKSGDWQPLTWMSWILDKQLFGMNPGGFHFVNVLLHAAVVCLLFYFIYKTTGYKLRALFIAAFFAVHPMRVESVAWVAERKDLLSAFWMMATLVFYQAYVKYLHGSARIKSLLFYWMMMLSYFNLK